MIRGVLVVIAGVLLFFSLLTVGISGDLSYSLQYNNVKANSPVFIENILGSKMNLSQIVESNMADIRIYCLKSPEFSLNYQGYVFQFPCSDANKGSGAIINDTLENFVDSLYYKNYTCSYWSCFQSYPVPPFPRFFC